ncbi:hypothetical protein WJX75_001635 [Coccomyxa subellipsoidea]|uniref:HYR domain-containing protein n=1 Tax=Coccomyxa subellipsoidea TaxID=248742 RepID=A0ABR2YCY9_9CHLO
MRCCLGAQFGSSYPTTSTAQEVMYFTTTGVGSVCIAAIPNTPTLLIPGGTVSDVQLCRALDYTDVGDALVATPGGVNIGPIDLRMQQTPFMRGTIWGAFNSMVTVGGAAQYGVVYFKTQGLSFTGGALDFTIGTYGYLRLASVSNTSIAPFPDQPETAVIAVGVAGLSTFLTFGYSIVNTAPGVGLASTIHLVSTSGQLTNDGVDRYGDYTAAAAAPGGSVWVAGMSSLPFVASNGQENWNTWITQVILPPVAICAAPVTLTANANACTDTISTAELTQAINNGSTSPGAPLTLGTTMTGALPVAGSYSLTAGQTYTVTLLATNAAGQSTCQTTVTVTAVTKPTAICKDAAYTSPDGNPVTVTSAALLAAIDNGSHSNGGDALTETLSPPANANGGYSLAVGASPFTLTVSNCAGTASCTATVTVTNQPVSTTIPTSTKPPAPGPCHAVCKPSVTLAATSNCAAQLSDADLFAAIDGGSGGSPTLAPVGPSVAPSMADLEPLSASNISCGALPTAGVLVTSLLTVHDSSTPAATYTPSYTKANGCHVSAVASGMDCSSCRLGGTILTKLDTDICRPTSQVSASGAVTISRGQVGRMAWTVTAQDALNCTVTGRCAVRVDHGDFGLTTLSACPRPFTKTTPCNAGHL